MSISIKISDSEWEVMNVVWKRSPIAASEIIDALAEKQRWHARTVRTLLDRLVKKQALTYKVEGKRFLYSPKLQMEACVKEATNGFLEKIFGGDPVAMLMHMVKHREMSPEELKKLRRILSERKE